MSRQRWSARAAVLGALVLGTLALDAGSPAWAKNPWEELMGRKPRTWADPQGRFSIDLPLGWQAQVNPEQPVVDFWKRHPDHGAVAHASVQMKSVPPGVKVAHYALHVNQDVKKSAPNYRVLAEQRLDLSGVPAVRTVFTYNERGNAALVNEVDQFVLVRGERAFVLTFEYAAGARPIFEEDFAYMAHGFAANAPGEEGVVGSGGGKSRRKIREGEMINPDVLRY
ncbi:MAG: hypothetical protein KC933_29525 [Myxococcales bacterium]|nr:hypothetical protein [Myxococcales bacterium]MCB9646343.1 hypothetical protein [Deltaproteobacteria bacterium]